jgi:CubicO group peptidase (beta-lactamase class C family)
LSIANRPESIDFVRFGLLTPEMDVIGHGAATGFRRCAQGIAKNGLAVEIWSRVSRLGATAAVKPLWLLSILASNLLFAAPAHAGDPWLDACAKIHELTHTKPPAVIPGTSVEPVLQHLRRGDAIGFAGAAAVRLGDRDLLDQGYGFADWRNGVEMTPATLFDIGSVSKQFTAAAILRLEELGRLRVEERINDFLPNVPPDKQAITIHQLLTHTAGFDQSVDAALEARTRNQAVAATLAAPLKSTPGEQYSYSNAGYSLLAAIVEIASGQSYEQFLRHELWLPAGLKHTGWVLFDKSRDQVALGYSAFGEFATPSPAWISDGPTWGRRGPGAILSSLDDLGRWARALRQGKVLSSASLEKMLTPHVPEGPKRTSFYGYGWAISTTKSGWCLISHNGTNNLHYNLVGFLPERDIIVQGVILDAFGPLRKRVVGSLLPIVADGAVSQLPDVELPGRRTATSLAGLWRAPDGSMVKLHERGDHLLIAANDPGVARLFTPFEPVPADVEARISPVESKLPEILDSLAAGKLAPLEARLSSRSTPAEEKQYWSETWPQWTSEYGQYKGTQIIGTSRREGGWVTWLLVRFAKRNIVIGANWDEFARVYLGNDIFVEPETEILPGLYSVAKAKTGSLAVYNLSFPGKVRLIPNREVRTMEIVGPARRAKLRKITALGATR